MDAELFRYLQEVIVARQEPFAEILKRLNASAVAAGREPLVNDVEQVGFLADHERSHAIYQTAKEIMGTPHLSNRALPPAYFIKARMAQAALDDNIINTNITDDDDVERELYLQHRVLGKLERYITDEFGEACEEGDGDPECCVCRAWAAYRNLRKALT